MVRDAIAAGIFNDLGSGSNVDLCVITKDETTYLRTYDEANLKGQRYVLFNKSLLSHRSIPNFDFNRQGNYSYKRSTTAVLSSKVVPLDVETVRVVPVAADQMEVA